MYPNKEHKFYGIYVRNFIDNFSKSKIQIVSTSIIIGRGKNKLEKTEKYLKFYTSIIRNLLFRKYDLIYVHYPSYASLPILSCLPFIHKPIVLNFHGTDILGKNKISRFLQILLKPLTKYSHSIVVPSSFFKEIVVAKLGIAKEKIFISPSGGVDTEYFNPLIKNNPHSFFKIGYVGRIDKGKGWKIFLKACSILKDEIPELKCLVAGDGAEVDDFKQTITTLGLTENIQFFGSIPHNELKKFYTQLDIFIFPTLLQESLGLVGVEALSCGVPVIGSRIGGLQDYIKDDVNGYLFEPGNHEELAAKILFLYKNESRLKQFKLAARNSVLSYDKKIVVNNLNLKLEEIFLAENK